MPKPIFTTTPQRSDGHGYIDCEPHRATSWAVRKSEKLRRGRTLYTVSTIIARCDTRSQADNLRDYAARSVEPPSRLYRLGARMAPREA